MQIRRLCFFLVLCGFFLPARAQTPNSAVWAGDARLQQTVSVEAEGVSVGELLARVHAVTGANVSADRIIADEKLVVFGPARPVAELLVDIAVLLNGTWKVGPSARASDPPRYVLGYAPGARQWEGDLRQKAALQRFRVLSNPPLYAATPDAPWRSLWIDMAAKPQNQAAFALLRRLPEEKQFALMRGEPVFVPAQALSQAEQESAALFAIQAAQTEAEMAADDRAHGFEPAPIENPAPPGAATGVWLHASQDALKTMVSLRHGSLKQLFGAVANRDGFVLPAHGFPYADANLEPETASEIELPPSTIAQATQTPTPGWTARLRAFAHRSGRPVVADFYRTAPIALLPEGGPTAGINTPLPRLASATVLMDAFCAEAGYLWWTGKASKTVFFRKRDWYEQKEVELPDRWYDDWTARMARQNNVPTYADVARLAAVLTEAQINGLLRGPSPAAPPKTDEEKRAARGAYWRKQDGKTVRNLLLILRAAPVQSKTLVPSLAALTPKERSRAWITTARSTPAQRTAWSTFARENLTLASRQTENDKFAVCISRGTPLLPPGKTSAPPETVEIMARYQIGKDNRIFGVSLPLPLRVPNDKRPQMKVELTQAQTDPK